MEDDSVIIKCKGVDSTQLTEQHFIDMLAGNTVHVDMNKIKTDFRLGTGKINSMEVKVQPEISNILISNIGINCDTIPFHVTVGEVVTVLNIDIQDLVKKDSLSMEIYPNSQVINEQETTSIYKMVELNKTQSTQVSKWSIIVEYIITFVKNIYNLIKNKFKTEKYLKVK